MTDAAPAPDPSVRPEAIRAVPVRHPGRWVAAVIILVLVAQLINWAVTNPAIKWDVVGDSTCSAASILKGVQTTIELTIIAMVIGIVFGVLLAVMRLSANPIVSGAAWVYIWFFRGTPVLVQLIFWYSIPTVLQSISLGIPFGPSWLITDDPKTLITQFVAVCLGLGLNEAAYMAEIARAGILSVGEGQVEAASALGMTRLQSMRRIVLPQAMRVIVPADGQRDHLHAQDHLVGIGDRVPGAAVHGCRSCRVATSGSSNCCWWPASGTCSSPPF